MIGDLSSIEVGKKAAALKALPFVKTGMNLGLGTGSTAAWFIKFLSDRITKEGLKISCVPTSMKTLKLAKSLNIPLTSMETVDYLDLVIDGADEFDPSLNLIKGGGGALLQEKIVASAAKKMVIITDSTKESVNLGRFALPVEIVQFGASSTKKLVEELLKNIGYPNAEVNYRMNKYNQKFVTDEGNFIVDLALMRIKDNKELEQNLVKCAGVIETGLFLGMAGTLVVGYPDGSSKIIGASNL